MNDTIDPNVVTVGVVTDLIKSCLSTARDALGRSAKSAFDRYFSNFEKHLKNAYERNSSVKILCSKDEPIEFDSIYVKSKFECNGKIHTDEEIVSLLKENRRIVISANGGAGKTFLMRYAWLSLFKRPEGRVPIFVELRKLNSLSTLDLVSFMRAEAFFGSEFSWEAFNGLCKHGTFVFILDGFDEVERDRRDELERQISQLARLNPKCGLIVSGRPSDRFSSWTEFSTMTAQPFEFADFRALIQRVPFDEVVKRRFLKLSTSNFFDKHKDFLSNPLLAIMMLMTFRDNAEIPTKINTFYENCFNTLYSRHDALKENYHRKKNLDQDSFRKIFSVFCLFSYIEQKYSMNEDEFRTFISKSLNYLKLNESVDGVADDFLESVNLIQREGTSYSFIHRSFQEYFAAYCATSVTVEKTEELLQIFADRHFDSTLSLAYEIHPNLVELKYFIPTYNSLKSENRIVTRAVKGKRFNAISAAGLKFGVGLSKIRRERHYDGKKESTVAIINDYNKIVFGFDRKFRAFYANTSRLSGFEAAQAECDDLIFQCITKIVGVRKELKEVKIGVGESMHFEVSFDDNATAIELTFSKDYKRNPSGTHPLLNKIRGIVEDFSEKIEAATLQLNRKVSESMSLMIEANNERKQSISDLFDV